MCAQTEPPPADPAALGRLLTQIENDPAQRRAVLAQLPATPRAQRIGVTGAPGVGKSTLLARLVPLLAERGSSDPHADLRVRAPALIAIDPSSARSGGAVLADRFRWNELAAGGVFMRSLASRGSLGGTSLAAYATLRVLEAAGYDPIVIETVGVGQTGFEISGIVDTVVLLLSPECGDSLQLLKAGPIEAGDIFVVNKGDRPGADALLADLRSALELEGDRDSWQPPVLQVSALNGEGVAELAQAIAAHSSWLSSGQAGEARRRTKLRLQLEAALRLLLEERAAQLLKDSPEVLDSVLQGRLDLDAAALELLRGLQGDLGR